MEQEKFLLAAQLRAARGLADLSQSSLADLAGVSSMTVKRAEGSGQPYPSQAAIQAIRNALENEGIEFIDENGGGAGVRLREPSFIEEDEDPEEVPFG